MLISLHWLLRTSFLLGIFRTAITTLIEENTTNSPNRSWQYPQVLPDLQERMALDFIIMLFSLRAKAKTKTKWPSVDQRQGDDGAGTVSTQC